MKKKLVLLFVFTGILFFGLWTYFSAQRELRVQIKIVHDARNGLLELAKKSARAAAYLAFFDKHAIQAITTQQKGLHLIGSRRSAEDFYVTAISTPLAIRKDGGMMAIATFSCLPTPVMVFQNYPTSGFMKGVILAHELSHAEDCTVFHQTYVQLGSDAFAQAEMKGYMVSIEILRDFNGVVWDLLVEKIRAQREKGALQAGVDPDAFAYGLLSENFEEVRTMLLPGMSNMDFNLLAGHLELAANFANQRHHGLRLNETEAQISTRQVKYMRSYLERVGHFY